MNIAKIKAKKLKPTFKENSKLDPVSSLSLSGDEFTHQIAVSTPRSLSGSVQSFADHQRSALVSRRQSSSHFSLELSQEFDRHAGAEPAIPESIAERFRHTALELKDGINKRMDDRVQALAAHNKWYEAEHDPTWQPGGPQFPVGFGFYVTKDYAKQQDAYLKKVYESIVALPNESVKDQLFSFLDDFRRMREIVKNSQIERSQLLTEVSLWIGQTELTDITDANWPVEKALNMELLLKDNYLNALSVMSRLYELKLEMGYMPKTLKAKPKQTDSRLQDTDSEAIVAHPMARDISRLFREAKNNENSYILDAEEKINGLITFLSDQEGAVCRTREDVEGKKSNLNEVKRWQEQNQQATTQLLARIKELEQLPDQDEKKASVVRKTDDITPKFSASVQTENENDAVVRGESTTKTFRQSVTGFLSPITNKESRRTSAEPCDNKDEQKSSVTNLKSDSNRSDAQNPMPPLRQASFANVVQTLRDKKTKTLQLPDTLDTEQIEMSPSVEELEGALLKLLENEMDEFQRKIRGGLLMEFAKIVPPRSLVEIEENKRKYREKIKQKSLDSKFPLSRTGSVTVVATGSRGKLETTKPVAEEDKETIAKMAKSFNYVISDNQTLLMSLLENVCQESDAELKRIEVLEQTVKCTKDNLTFVFEKIRSSINTFPSVDISEAMAVVKDCTPLPHTCRYCECHLCMKDSILNTEKTLRTLGKTLAFCTRYSLILSSVKKRYSSMTQQLADTRAFLEAQLQNRSSLGYSKTALSLLLTVIGDETQDCTKQSTDSSTANLADRLRSARSLVRIASDRAGQLVKIFESVRLRWQDLQQQSCSLDDVQRQLERVQEVLINTGLDVARLRGGQNFLLMSKHMQDMRCQYCKCYFSPFPEDMRGEVAERFGPAPGQPRKALFSALSHLQQGEESVLAVVGREDDDGPWQCVSGVHTEALLLMGEARGAVNKSLNFFTEASGMKRESISQQRKKRSL